MSYAMLREAAVERILEPGLFRDTLPAMSAPRPLECATSASKKYSEARSQDVLHTVAPISPILLWKPSTSNQSLFLERLYLAH